MCKSYGGRSRDYVRVVLTLGLVLSGFASCERTPAPVTHQDSVASTSSAADPVRAELSARPSQETTIRPCSTTKAFFAGTAIAGREDWYGGHLAALGERILCQQGDAAPTVFRLTWLPSFHHSVVVRVEQTAGQYRLAAKAESGAGGYEAGHRTRETARPLSALERDAFDQLLRQSDFWHLPTVPPPNGTIGLDGAQWVLEGMKGGRYHVVDRWSPDVAGPDAKFRQLAEWLLAKSALVPAKLVREY